MITFSKNLFGSDTHLVYDGKYKWSKNIPEESWVFGQCHPYEIGAFLSTWGIAVPKLVEDKYKKMASVLGLSDPPWYNILGRDFRQAINKLAKTLLCQISELKDSTYTKHYRIMQDFLWSLEKSPVNKTRLNSLKFMDINLPGLTESNGMFDVVRYDRRTSTGRLRVTSGPSVLTLKADHRNVLSGCHQVDFQNMEPRLLLAFLGKNIKGDLYEHIQKELNIKGDRSYIKVSIISSMYGSKVVPEISKFFALDEWVAQLESNVQNDRLDNFFGRPVFTKGVTGRHLLSLWLQSSAADAALLGFSNMFKDYPDLKPHWIIHDACIFSGKGKIPKHLKITDDIFLPIVCTEI